jgi:hypothetical protein
VKNFVEWPVMKEKNSIDALYGAENEHAEGIYKGTLEGLFISLPGRLF